MSGQRGSRYSYAHTARSELKSWVAVITWHAQDVNMNGADFAEGNTLQITLGHIIF